MLSRAPRALWVTQIYDFPPKGEGLKMYHYPRGRFIDREVLDSDPAPLPVLTLTLSSLARLDLSQRVRQIHPGEVSLLIEVGAVALNQAILDCHRHVSS